MVTFDRSAPRRRLVAPRPAALASVVAAAAAAALAVGFSGCASNLAPYSGPPKRLKVPDTMRRQEGQNNGRVYVVRMSENGRTWELDLPEIAGGYVLRLPLSATQGPPDLVSPVDEAILSDSLGAPRMLPPANGGTTTTSNGGGSADNAKAGTPGNGNGNGASATTGGNGAKGPVGPNAPVAPGKPRVTPQKSYLATLARVQQLYAAKRYELALIELNELEQYYPDDARLLTMKGSLYARLGKTNLARDSWSRALELRPDDSAVAEALRQLETSSRTEEEN